MTGEPIYEDDNVKVSIVQPDRFMRLDDIGAIEPSPAERAYWENSGGPDVLDIPVSVTLTAHQWAGVLAMQRYVMAFMDKPGTARLAHDAIYAQIPLRKPDNH